MGVSVLWAVGVQGNLHTRGGGVEVVLPWWHTVWDASVVVGLVRSCEAIIAAEGVRDALLPAVERRRVQVQWLMVQNTHGRTSSLLWACSDRCAG